MPQVLAVGEALIDAIGINPSESLKDAREFRVQTGGSPANFCSYLQQLGVDTSLVAAVGKDGFGDVVLSDLRSKGLNTDFIQQVDGRSTSLIMVSRSAGTPDFIPYRDADRYLGPVPGELIRNAELVHSTAFALSRQPARKSILDALKNAAASGKLVSVDWNYSGKIWRSHARAKKVFGALCALNPMLKFSMDDAERYLELPVSVHEAKAFLERLPARVVCLTCGKDGVWYKDENNAWEHKSAEPIMVKDATGAGDSFWAGFVAAFLNGHALSTCVERGMTTAAKKLQGLPFV